MNRVLVVEDDPTVAEVLAFGLRRAGLTVVTAATGTRAMRHFWRAVDMQRPFKVVVLDCALPLLDGWSVAANIRRAERAVRGLRPAYLLGYTGYGEEAVMLVTERDAAKFDRVLVKGREEWGELLDLLVRAAEREWVTS